MVLVLRACVFQPHLYIVPKEGHSGQILACWFHRIIAIAQKYCRFFLVLSTYLVRGTQVVTSVQAFGGLVNSCDDCMVATLGKD